MSWNVYLIGEKLLVPTSVKATAGFYLEVDPVFVGQIEDAPGSANAIARALELGNAIVPTPDWKRAKPPVVLSYAGVRNWSSFFRRATCWKVLKGEQSYTVTPCRRMPDHDAWEEDRERGVAIPDGPNVDEVARQVFEVIRSSACSSTAIGRGTRKGG
jgi:hypothetical protein